MPLTRALHVRDLSLDLKNYRTVLQETEVDAIRALISIEPDWYWALMESLIADGYLPTENIIVLKKGKQYVVKEGNRRISALKLIHGFISRDGFDLPSAINDKIERLSDEWRKSNSKIPCTIYELNEEALVNKVVALIHGKGEKAGRLKWDAVARARHSRDQGAVEAALDLLEKYLEVAKNITPTQRERWAGDYPLSILEEAMKRLASRLNMTSAPELATNYPKLSRHKKELDDIIRDIGLGQVGFQQLRDTTADYLQEKYGISPQSARPGNPSPSKTAQQSQAHPKPRALALDDSRSVHRALREFSPRGKNREKVVTLLGEIRTLRLSKHPHAFCFLLRSMFEISAKAYCKDHAAGGGPKYTKANGEDRALVEVLRDITSHLTRNNSDRHMKKLLHGAMVELGKSNGILSVTSMNQLVHNPKFSVKERDICSLFHNVFPLLEEMNR